MYLATKLIFGPNSPMMQKSGPQTQQQPCIQMLDSAPQPEHVEQTTEILLANLKKMTTTNQSLWNISLNWSDARTTILSDQAHGTKPTHSYQGDMIIILILTQKPLNIVCILEFDPKQGALMTNSSHLQISFWVFLWSVQGVIIFYLFI